MPSPIAVAVAKNLPGNNTGASSTTELQFLDSKGNSAILYLPGSSRLDKRMFRVRAYGYFNTGATTNATIALYYGIDATVANNTKVGASGARAVNTAKAPWFIECLFMWDSVSQKIFGIQNSVCGTVPTLDAPAVLSNNVTSADPATEGLGFTVTNTFSVSNANNIAVLTSFELEAL